MIRRNNPLTLTVSPLCTFFSIANQGPICPKELAGAIEIVKFTIEMCDVQRREGRYFIFEQPQGYRAWDLEAVKGHDDEAGHPDHYHASVHVWPQDSGGHLKVREANHEADPLYEQLSAHPQAPQPEVR